MSESSVHFLFHLEESPDSLTIPTTPVCKDRTTIDDPRQTSLGLDTEHIAIRAWQAIEALTVPLAPRTELQNYAGVFGTAFKQGRVALGLSQAAIGRTCRAP